MNGSKKIRVFYQEVAQKKDIARWDLLLSSFLHYGLYDSGKELLKKRGKRFLLERNIIPFQARKLDVNLITPPLSLDTGGNLNLDNPPKVFIRGGSQTNKCFFNPRGGGINKCSILFDRKKTPKVSITVDRPYWSMTDLSLYWHYRRVDYIVQICARLTSKKVSICGDKNLIIPANSGDITVDISFRKEVEGWLDTHLTYMSNWVTDKWYTYYPPVYQRNKKNRIYYTCGNSIDFNDNYYSKYYSQNKFLQVPCKNSSVMKQNGAVHFNRTHNEL